MINSLYKILQYTNMNRHLFLNLFEQQSILIIKSQHTNDKRVLEIKMPAVDHVPNSTYQQSHNNFNIGQQDMGMLDNADEETKIAIRPILTQIHQLKKQDVRLTTCISCLRFERQKRRKCWEPIFQEYQQGFIQIKQSIQSINTNQFNQLRAFARPPPTIQFVLAPIYLLLQGDPQGLLKVNKDRIEWANIRILLNHHFLERILKFRAYDANKRVVDYIQREYLQADYWNLESIRKMSEVLFIFAKWIEHQVHLFEAINLVQPFKQDINIIQEASDQLGKRKMILAQRIFKEEQKVKQMIKPKMGLQKNEQIMKDPSDLNEIYQKKA